MFLNYIIWMEYKVCFLFEYYSCRFCKKRGVKEHTIGISPHMYPLYSLCGYPQKCLIIKLHALKSFGEVAFFHMYGESVGDFPVNETSHFHYPCLSLLQKMKDRVEVLLLPHAPQFQVQNHFPSHYTWYRSLHL